MQKWQLVITMLLTCTAATAQTSVPVLGPDLEKFEYPHEVHRFRTSSQGHAVEMAYMDIRPTGAANGRTAVLLHGKNFCAATWETTAEALADKGYRVIVPDQIGFCKSSKPGGYQYSFHALATLTRDLLDEAGADKVALIGHSTGGMLAARFALLYPDHVDRLVLVNPLGLNDTIAEGVPYTDLGKLLEEEAKTSATTIKSYQQNVYYHGNWRPEYDRWVAMLAGMYEGPDGQVVREAQARLSDMIQTQPVAAELPSLRTPTVLMIGMLDKTAFRANAAPQAARDAIRRVPAAAEDAVRRIPGAKMVRFDDLGHSPQVEAPERFNAALLDALSAEAGQRP